MPEADKACFRQFYSLMKHFVIFFFFLLAAFASSCSLFESEPSNMLDGDYDLVVGLLSPDSSRTNPHEIFVGRITPSANPSRPPSGSDREVNRCFFGITRRYLMNIRPRTDAQVVVRNEAGEEIPFRHVGNGFYRDEQNRLKVDYQKRYTLEARYDGKTITGQTVTPERFGFTNVRNGDTVRVLPDARGDYLMQLQYSRPQGSAFYRRSGNQSNFDGTNIFGCSYEQFVQTNFFFYLPPSNPATVIRTDREVMALDSNHGNIFEPSGDDPNGSILFGTGGPWGDWHDNQSKKSIRERSVLQGYDRVVGVFGSYTMARVSFYTVRAN
jgi:hypothetical protein